MVAFAVAFERESPLSRWRERAGVMPAPYCRTASIWMTNFTLSGMPGRP